MHIYIYIYINSNNNNNNNNNTINNNNHHYHYYHYYPEKAAQQLWGDDNTYGPSCFSASDMEDPFSFPCGEVHTRARVPCRKRG